MTGTMEALPVKSNRKTTTVSLKGDRRYVRALGAVAAVRGVLIAELVREALDRTYGNDIERQLSFFDEIGTPSFQSEPARKG